MNNLLLGAESQLLLPDMEEAMRLGHAFYASDHPDLTGSNSQKLAQSAVEQFLALKPRNAVEDAYLLSLKTAVFGLARGLRRRKDAHTKAYARADKEMFDKKATLSKARNEAIWLQYFWLIMRAGTVGFFGYMLTYLTVLIFGDLISTETSDTVTKLTGTLVAFGSVCIWRWLLGFINEVRRSAIEVTYWEQLSQADSEYNKGRQAESEAYSTSLCEAWKQYTGKDFTATFSYRQVIEIDILMKEQAERRRKNGTSMSLTMRLARIFRMRFRRKGKHIDRQVWRTLQ